MMMNKMLKDGLIVGVLVGLYYVLFMDKAGVSDPGTLSKNATITA